jgi:catechol 2,3-dioxygenase-like lactoylglutathione lyase family enzyme
MSAHIHAFLLLVILAAPFVASEEKPIEKERGKLKIALTSVFVSDQEKALKFYTEVLGFVKKFDVPVGKFKWLTVVSAEETNGTELLLEPNDNPIAKTYQEALFKQGIPAKVFTVEDIQKEFQRLKKLGVVFKTEPTSMGPVTIAVLDDTCGNLIQIMQPAQK